VDKIVIKDLEVEARVGVSDAERAHAQRLLVTVELERDLAEAGRPDDMNRTADYAAVAGLIRETVAKKPRNLIEAVAEEIAEALLSRRLANAVTVEVKKFSIPGVQFVAVQIRRPR